MENKDLTIREVIYRDMDTLIMAKLKNGSNISIDDLIDISSYLAASLFRERSVSYTHLTLPTIRLV